MYEAWGALVSARLKEEVSKKLPDGITESFFKVPISFRVKTESSLLAKAFYRPEKKYADPYNEIEDKVGIRIIVLFSEDIRLVERCIKEIDIWDCHMARDFEDERNANPYEFDYQSLHYIVRSACTLVHRDTRIEKSLPCEIQVRTLLQHAYSELTHDTIYKPKVKATPEIKRSAAKSMALIEATDDYFSQVRRKLQEIQAPGEATSANLSRIYKDIVGREPDPSPLNTIIIDHYNTLSEERTIDYIIEFFNEKQFLVNNIIDRYTENLLYRQPSVLFLYYLARTAPRALAFNSPLSDEELKPIYTDLGKRLPDDSN